MPETIGVLCYNSGMDKRRFIGLRISALMFVQYMMLPVWLLPLLPYVETLDGGAGWMFAFGVLSGIGTFASPFVCMFADRFLNGERVLAICNAVTAALLFAAFFTTSLPVLFALLLLALVVYMPSWSVSSAIAMEHSSPVAFPRYRTLGSLGWVASGVFSIVAAKWFGKADFDSSRWIFAAGAGLAALGTAIALVQPPTPPRARGTRLSVADAFGLRAFSLFRDRNFAVFATLLLLAMVPFQWYMVYNPVYLSESGYRYLTMTQNIGQAGEIAFMLLIPFAVRRFGYRAAFSAGLGFLALRYFLFFLAARCGFAVGNFGGIVVHGLIFGLVVVVAQMYVGEYAPAALRNQAQGLAILLTSGLGLFLSNLVMHPLIAASVRAVPSEGHDWSLPFMVSCKLSVLLAVAAAVLFKPCVRAGKD